ncbi:hypothetical protein V6N11_009331 [Hibiscus sabdariffa]|uniref:RNase H type-1 domain-containing protein n=1 Tax=Hibiscus sabdariffa TaxID=183260 RepID=A0ABR2PQH0_9ROSI
MDNQEAANICNGTSSALASSVLVAQIHALLHRIGKFGLTILVGRVMELSISWRVLAGMLRYRGAFWPHHLVRWPCLLLQIRSNGRKGGWLMARAHEDPHW